MKITDQIHQFTLYNEEQAKKLKEALGLKMPMETLAFCIKYYRDGAHRDPYADEILMLDALSHTLEGEINSIAPTDLYTSDEFAAETYADIMAKRRALDPHAPHPCTLSDALKMASAYLFSVGRDPRPYRGVALMPENLSDCHSMSSESCVSVPNAPYRLRILPGLCEKEEAGDLLLLLSPGSRQTRLQFQKSCECLFKEEELTSSLRAVYTVQPGGVLPTLLEITNGVSVLLNAFSALETALPMTVLTDGYAGCRILRIKRAAEDLLLPLLRHTALSAAIIGEITDDGLYTFRREDMVPFGIDPRFLRSLFHYKGIQVTLPAEAELSPISHRTVTALNCAYITPDKNTEQNEVCLKNGILTAASNVTITASPMQSALYATILPLLTLSAHGVSLADQCLSIGLEVPKDLTDSRISGETLAAILGLYRAEIELAVPAQAIAVRTVANKKSLSITVFASAKGDRALPGRLTHADSRIYCLAPRFYKDGHPDFDSLREMMRTLSDLSGKGAIRSMQILCNESVTAGLAKMSGCYMAKLCDGKIAAEGALPIGILIESDRVLPWREVAVSRPCEQTETVADIPICKKHSIIWSERPVVVILSKTTDADAGELASILEARGCEVYLHTNSSDPAPLSRVLLGAGTLILCRGASLPTDEKVRFAYAVMKTAGGLLLSFGNAETAPRDFIALPKGLNSTLLDQICPLKRKK